MNSNEGATKLDNEPCIFFASSNIEHCCSSLSSVVVLFRFIDKTLFTSQQFRGFFEESRVVASDDVPLVSMRD
jgi:hypothetical protein